MRVLMICPELPSEESPGSMAPGARQIRSIAAAGLDVEILEMRGIPKLKYLQLLPRARRAIPNVDLVHCHFGYCGWLALVGRRLALSHVPIVMSFMGDDLLGTPIDEKGGLERSSVWAADFNRKLAGRYDQVIVKSPEMAKRITPVPCNVIPNGVDFNIFQPQPRSQARAALGWAQDGLKILFPGDPSNPRKGFGLAQSAVQFAQQQMDRTLELVPLWGIQPDQVATVMNACDAMLMTSSIEGSPNVVKEALACNANVIGVPVGDVHDLLGEVEHCYCVDRDPQAIGSALVRALRVSKPSSGRDRLQARGLSLQGVAQQIIQVYHRALEARSRCGLQQAMTSSSE